MSAVTASLCSTLLFIGLFLFVSADPKTITAESGQDVTLTCRAPNNKIIILEWSRADLGDKYVFLLKDKHFVPDHQHPSFMNRVDLQDRQMKDGDVSLILKDVTINDAGTYECRFFMEKPHTWKNGTFVYLDVVPPGQTGGQVKDEDRRKEDGSVGLIVYLKSGLRVGLTVGLIVGLIVYAVSVVVGFWIKKPLQSKTDVDPEITQPLSSLWEDSYTDGLKIS